MSMNRISVTVLSPFSIQPQDVDLFEGESVRFQCAIAGVPKLDIVWKKNDASLPSNYARYIQCLILWTPQAN